MTGHKVTAVDNYEFTSGDQLFFDTNIWLYIYGPQKPGDSRVRTYSGALRHILEAQSQIYIDVLIISEFINAYAKIRWSSAGSELKFKDFRNQSDFRPVAQDIASDVRCVMEHCSRIEHDFAALEIDSLLDDYAEGRHDFNDQMIARLCERSGLTLITHDADFKGQQIPILTANRRLLS